jgi:copper(I)-binding protein
MAVRIGILVAGIFTVVPAGAQGVFVVYAPWVRPAAEGGATEACMELTSVDGGALVGARSEFAGSVALVGPGAKIKLVERLPLPPGAPVILTPDSYRLRLARVNRVLKLGDHVPLVLIIEAADGRREEVSVTAEVRRRSTVDDHLRGHRH